MEFLLSILKNVCTDFVCIWARKFFSFCCFLLRRSDIEWGERDYPNSESVHYYISNKSHTVLVITLKLKPRIFKPKDFTIKVEHLFIEIGREGMSTVEVNTVDNSSIKEVTFEIPSSSEYRIIVEGQCGICGMFFCKTYELYLDAKDLENSANVKKIKYKKCSRLP